LTTLQSAIVVRTEPVAAPAGWASTVIEARATTRLAAVVMIRRAVPARVLVCLIVVLP
jgi:hypothetical protein